MVEVILEVTVVLLLLYIIWIQRKTYITTHLTLVGLYLYLELVKEKEGYGEAEQFH